MQRRKNGADNWGSDLLHFRFAKICALSIIGNKRLSFVTRYNEAIKICKHRTLITIHVAKHQAYGEAVGDGKDIEREIGDLVSIWISRTGHLVIFSRASS